MKGSKFYDENMGKKQFHGYLNVHSTMDTHCYASIKKVATP